MLLLDGVVSMVCVDCGIQVPSHLSYFLSGIGELCKNCYYFRRYGGSTIGGPKTQQQGGNVPKMTPQSNTKCRIWWDESILAYRISCPYSPQFIEFLKLGIPVGKRAYDPSTKIWTFSEQFFDLVESTARKVWKNQGEVVVVTKAQAQAASAPPAVAHATLDSVMLEFVKLLPERALLQAFRFAAAELHPDKGGSMELMSKLNTLWDRIKLDKGLK